MPASIESTERWSTEMDSSILARRASNSISLDESILSLSLAQRHVNVLVPVIYRAALLDSTVDPAPK